MPSVMQETNQAVKTEDDEAFAESGFHAPDMFRSSWRGHRLDTSLTASSKVLYPPLTCAKTATVRIDGIWYKAEQMKNTLPVCWQTTGLKAHETYLA